MRKSDIELGRSKTGQGLRFSAGVAGRPDLFPPGGVCHGATSVEAYGKLCEIVEETVETIQEQGLALPLPHSRPILEVERLLERKNRQWLAPKANLRQVWRLIRRFGMSTLDFMTDPQPAKDREAKLAGQRAAGRGTENHEPGAASPQPAAPALTPDEQMELYERDLKENDWGHQPC